jgi:hypothetical protein
LPNVETIATKWLLRAVAEVYVNVIEALIELGGNPLNDIPYESLSIPIPGTISSFQLAFEAGRISMTLQLYDAARRQNKHELSSKSNSASVKLCSWLRPFFNQIRQLEKHTMELEQSLNYTAGSYEWTQAKDAFEAHQKLLMEISKANEAS